MTFLTHGYRKIQAALLQEGIRINHKKIQRLMKMMGIKALYASPQTSKSCQHHTPYPYLLKGLHMNRPNQVWAVDLNSRELRLRSHIVTQFKLGLSSLS